MEVILKATSRFLHAFAMAQPSKAEIQSMTKEPIGVLDDLADQVADEFGRIDSQTNSRMSRS